MQAIANDTTNAAPGAAAGSANRAAHLAAGPAKAEGGEFLTFRLGAEEYGIEILKVREIRSWEAPTAIANTPEFIKGVINLRGTIVPVVDMRLKFKLGKADYNEFTVMIILNIAHRVVGMVVDGVSDVMQLSAEQIRPAPELGGAVNTRFITGIGALDKRMLILVDIEKLMSGSDMSLMDAASSQSMQ